MPIPMPGGYDDGYQRCSCFWGREPGSLVQKVVQMIEAPCRLSILDAGCGEGKNAVYLAKALGSVRAIDVSALAIRNGREAWGSQHDVKWEVADIRHAAIPESCYDLVVAYGLLHCLDDLADIVGVVQKLQHSTKVGGFHVICSFNDRYHDVGEAHCGFSPVLINHRSYLEMYGSWAVSCASDSDLVEAHPNTGIVHRHSLTRFIAQRTSNV